MCPWLRQRDMTIACWGFSSFCSQHVGAAQGRRWGSKHRGGDGLLGEQQDGAGMGLFRRGDTVVFTSSTRRGQGQARCPQRQVLILAYPSVGVPGASGDAKVTQRWSGARLRDCEGGAPGATPRPGSRRASLKDGGLQLRSGSTMPAKMLLCLLLARTQPRVGRWVMERCRNGIRRCGAPPQSVQGRPRLRKWPGRWSSLMGWGRPQLLGTN